MDAKDEVVIRASISDYPYPGFMDPVREMAEQFGARHPGYRVELTGCDFRKVPQEVAEAAVRGEAPHIAGYYYTASQFARDTRDASGNPLFTSIEKEVAGRTEILGEPVRLGDIIPAARDYYSYDGELVSVPFTASTLVMFANADLLAAAGVHELPSTWETLEAACQAVEKHTGGACKGVAWPNHGWVFQQAVGQQVGLMVDHDNGRSGRAERVHLTSPEMMEYVLWWRRMYMQGHYLYTGKVADWIGPAEAFLEQRTALFMTSSVEEARLTAAGREAGFRVVSGFLPYNASTVNAGTSIAGDSLWLASGLDPVTRDGALAFIQFLLSPENAARWHRVNGRIPLTRPAIELLDSEGWFSAHPNARVAVDQLRGSHRSPADLGMVTGAFSAIQFGAAEAMHDVLAEGVDPYIRFTNAESHAQQALEDYNASCTGTAQLATQNLTVMV